ncbi:MAG: hypothetical protein JO271_18295 [Verrucomicrobia bacterium]|nr:hypothetical protein [Verrucomicrobiota bacterium]MBV9274442.1 hypothetical protein [Verrucomicrobiota bacterium]
MVPIAVDYAESLNTAKNLDPADRVSLQLAAGVASYLGSAYLLDKWYGLSPDPVQLLKNNVLTFTNERALSFQLDAAKQNALIAAAECKTKLGFIPDEVAYEFQGANGSREGDDKDKLNSLLDYWHATFFAHLAVQLAAH